MSPTIAIRDMKLGEGKPKICIPLTDPDLSGLKASIGALRDFPCDFIEWRADFYYGLYDPSARKEALKLFRKELPGMPVLFTIRTRGEMGSVEIDTNIYKEINLSVIGTGLADMVDIELSRGEDILKEVLDSAHAAGVKVIASRHDCKATPPKEEIVNTLCTMQALGADIAKFAVMPQSDRDVLTLLDATLTMKEQHNDTPVITMSMGSPGAVSRVCGSLTGSAVTFGTAGKASAPGQLPADVLKEFLNRL